MRDCQNQNLTLINSEQNIEREALHVGDTYFRRNFNRRQLRCFGHSSHHGFKLSEVVHP